MILINCWAVVGAAVTSMVLGALWYGPLFGKRWIQLSQFTAEQMTAAKAKGMGKSYALMGLGSLLMSTALSHLITFAGAPLGMSGASLGAVVGVLVWLGFIAPVTVGPVLWEGKPWKLWYITSGYYLVSLVIMGKILAVWT